jgi:transcriptional regulator with XRE-family HTH domain
MSIYRLQQVSAFGARSSQFRYSKEVTTLNFGSVDDSFGSRFLAARREKDLSQEAVVTALEARGIKLHVTAIGKIERGERRVTVGEASALASVLGYTLDGLIGGGGDLVTQYALMDFVQTQLNRATTDYVNALVRVARAADEMSQPLRDEDREWLTKQMPQVTPALLVGANALLQLESRLSNEGVTDQGEFVQLLRGAIGSDRERLSERGGTRD